MITEQLLWSRESGWNAFHSSGTRSTEAELTNPSAASESDSSGRTSHLVLAFGDRDLLADETRYQELRERFPTATIICCSTAGEILGDEVYDQTIVATSIRFEQTEFHVASLGIDELSESWGAGFKLATQLPSQNLSHVFVFSDGQNVNGSELIHGMNEALPQRTPITGGLAGDRDRFEVTLLGVDQAPSEKQLVAVGLYGDKIQVGYGSVGGWKNVGPRHVITRSEANVLYELDGRSALELYREYLGELAEQLPASALLFPLGIQEPEGGEMVVRTILSVDDDEEAMIFAGDMQQGAYAQLMEADFDRLVEGASNAAEQSNEVMEQENPEFALLISCVGRKLVLKEETVREVQAVRRVLGEKTVITGFYSYGEISPMNDSITCQLHNQTMTITTLKER